MKIFWRDTDDGEGGLMQTYGRSEYGWIAAESPLPVVVADHGVRIFSNSRCILLCEDTASSGFDAEDGEIVFADQTATKLFQRSAGDPNGPSLKSHLRRAQSG
jgi:hypothetical protein